jgi:hypothetical protein
MQIIDLTSKKKYCWHAAEAKRRGYWNNCVDCGCRKHDETCCTKRKPGRDCTCNICDKCGKLIIGKRVLKQYLDVTPLNPNETPEDYPLDSSVYQRICKCNEENQ